MERISNVVQRMEENLFWCSPFQNHCMHSFSWSKWSAVFIIGSPIVDVVLWRLLFNPGSDEHMSESVLKIFEPLYNAENQYVVTEDHVIIKNMNLFNIAVGMVAMGSSFRLASRQLLWMREELQFGFLGGCDGRKVFTFIRVVVGACLQSLCSSLNKVWAFSVAFDLAIVESASYFNVRIWFIQRKKLHCFHLFARQCMALKLWVMFKFLVKLLVPFIHLCRREFFPLVLILFTILPNMLEICCLEKYPRFRT